MATDTAIHFPSLMFEDVWPALVGMALDTRLLAIVGLVEHFGRLSHAEGWGEAAVRVVTIAACHETFVHTMLERQIELRAHVRVTLVAHFGLTLGEQVLGRGRTVNRVAGGAGDVVLGVFRAPDIGAAELFGVAVQA